MCALFAESKNVTKLCGMSAGNRQTFVLLKRLPTALHHYRSASSSNSLKSAGANTAPRALSPAAAKEIETCYERLDLSFENTKGHLRYSKTNFDLIRGLVVLRLCSIDILVQNNQKILHYLRKVLGANVFKKILKSSFYGHFVAGENRAEVEPTVGKLAKFGVKSILDYSVESDISQEEAEEKAVEGVVGETNPPDVIADSGIVDEQTVTETHERYTVHKDFGDRRVDVVGARTYFYAGERECDRNRDIFLQSIDAVAETTRAQGWAAVKLTALGRPQLLLKISEMIAQTQNFYKALTGSSYENLVLSRMSHEDFIQRIKEFGIKADREQLRDLMNTTDFDGDGFVDFHDWGTVLDHKKKLGEMFRVLNIKTGKLEPLIEDLTDNEEREFTNMMQRIVDVGEHAVNKGVRIMIDAEQSYFQPAISRLALAMMRKYNKERGNIFNTYQAYLKSTLSTIEIDMHLARRENFHFGCKLVRGAYMDQERKRAEAVGYDDPINPSFEATSDMYDRCMRRIVEEREVRGPGHVSVMVASHNEDAIRNAVQLMKERSIAPSERVICFAQLYGMCDQVSFSLGQAGYSVYKYLPYGPVEDVLPYLSRRALENGGMLQKVERERALMWRELMRRYKKGKFTHPVPK
ncbi:hypothetical protein L596_005027 [Steinernema carpocapsae]|uniref:Proline dehydrogenase n=1 Tax=Steinernema carpocapsae TaxID=34508 RepID=A0A4U8UXX8_STECR|nr:hypothetical protein L596_005027 [Steinernema carpocapsae]